MYKSVFKKIHENQKIINEYKIVNDDICRGKILMKRYRYTSFLGMDLKVWKLKNFSIEDDYFHFWRVDDDDHMPEVVKKYKLKNLRCGKMFSSKEWIPKNFDYNKPCKKYVFKFNVYKGSKTVMKLASLRLDSIETLYNELAIAFDNSDKL